MRNLHLTSLLLLLLPAAPLPAADEPPAPEALRGQARRCRQILKTSLVDFYLPAAIDRTNGGYLESLRDGKLTPIEDAPGSYVTVRGED